ncbi:MAG TPA: DUF2950 domain-containing protein [Pseudomonadales bacterium]|nr:DUF2950 domain-containing protein [Pseudomonadales bacterium]
MKTSKPISNGINRVFWNFALALILSVPFSIYADEEAETFATPDQAVSALVAAVNATNRNELHAIFGPAITDIQNPDRVQATNDLARFARALNTTNWLEHEPNGECTLEIGADAWPFPIPLVEKDGKWFFDTAAGEEELLNRRIGKNELKTLDVVRAYVDAQREYASADRDGDGVLQFAQQLISSDGKKDGLYWPPDLDGEISPLGPLVAYADSKGYNLKGRDNSGNYEPYNGYYFKILTRQGKHAPGGAYNYIINGNMIAGFALVAWPAEYGKTGIMTFIVNQQGLVYQKDLGEKTAKTASSMKKYDPDSTWQLSPD